MKNILILTVVLISALMLIADEPEPNMVCEYILDPEINVMDSSDKPVYILVCKPVVEPKDYSENGPGPELLKPIIQKAFQTLKSVK